MNKPDSIDQIDIPSRDKDKVLFTPIQLRYLKENFPTIVQGPKVTLDELRHYNGQQSVIDFIEKRMR